jgi:hypothetical protein
MKINTYLKTCLSAACIAAFLMLTGASSAFAREVSGINLDETIQVDGQTLILNGAGVHVINRVKIFALGYYLPKAKNTQQELLASPGIIRIKIVMIKAVESELMSRRFLADIRTSTTKEERVQLLSQMLALGQGFAALGDWKVGDIMTIDWAPGKGTKFSSNGKQIGEVLKDDLTMQALMRIWVGDNSNDQKLKRQLLGERE